MSPRALAAVIGPSETPASSPHAAADGDPPLPLRLGALPLPLARSRRWGSCRTRGMGFRTRGRRQQLLNLERRGAIPKMALEHRAT